MMKKLLLLIVFTITTMSFGQTGPVYSWTTAPTTVLKGTSYPFAFTYNAGNDGGVVNYTVKAGNNVALGTVNASGVWQSTISYLGAVANLTGNASGTGTFNFTPSLTLPISSTLPAGHSYALRSEYQNNIDTYASGTATQFVVNDNTADGFAWNPNNFTVSAAGTIEIPILYTSTTPVEIGQIAFSLWTVSGGGWSQAWRAAYSNTTQLPAGILVRTVLTFTPPASVMTNGVMMTKAQLITANPNAASPTPTNYYYEVRATFGHNAAGTFNPANSVGFMEALASNIWTGATNTDWATASNWSAGVVPTGTTNVVIAAAGGPSTLGANTTFNSLTIKSGATLNVAEGRFLTVTGAIGNYGDLVLKSSALGTASLLSTANVSVENLTQQSYLVSNQRGWRLISNPFANAPFTALGSSFTLGNGFTGEYDSASDTWTSTNGSATMLSQRPYKVFFTGITGESPNYTAGPPSHVTLSMKGTATNVAPTQIATVAGRYYLVANPYTAPVSVTSILAASTNLSTSISYYNPTKGSTDVKVNFGGYDAKMISGVAGSATDVVIPPMGAIFVQALTNGTINVPKTAIFIGTNNSGTYSYRTTQANAAAPVALTLDITSNGVAYDKLQLHFKDAGTAGNAIDFGKLPNTVLDFYSFDNSKKMAISEIELKEQTIALGINTTIQKSYTINVAENTIPTGFDAVLVDNVMKTSTVLAKGTAYNFAIDSTPASQGTDRFSVVLKTAGTLSLDEKVFDSKIQLFPNPASTQFNVLNSQNSADGSSTIEISNVNGQMIHSQKSNPGSSTTIQTSNWAKGVYILKATNNGSQTIKKLIIQ